MCIRDSIKHLIAQKRYFVLHAPRQTGKTTCLLALMDHLNQQSDYHVLYANIEAAQAYREHISEVMRTVCYTIANRAVTYLDEARLLPYLDTIIQRSTGSVFTELLEYWTKISNKPTVLLLDEVDALVGDSLISLLRQIRAGYAQRPDTFPISIILCGCLL